MLQQLLVKDLQETLEMVRKAKYIVGCNTSSAEFVTTSLEDIYLFGYSYIAFFADDGSKLGEWRVEAPSTVTDSF